MFRASPAGEPLIEAIDYLKTLDGDKKKATAKPPLDIVDAAWHLRSVRRQSRSPLIDGCQDMNRLVDAADLGHGLRQLGRTVANLERTHNRSRLN